MHQIFRRSRGNGGGGGGGGGGRGGLIVSSVLIDYNWKVYKFD